MGTAEEVEAEAVVVKIAEDEDDEVVRVLVGVKLLVVRVVVGVSTAVVLLELVDEVGSRALLIFDKMFPSDVELEVVAPESPVPEFLSPELLVVVPEEEPVPSPLPSPLSSPSLPLPLPVPVSPPLPVPLLVPEDDPVPVPLDPEPPKIGIIRFARPAPSW